MVLVRRFSEDVRFLVKYDRQSVMILGLRSIVNISLHKVQTVGRSLSRSGLPAFVRSDDRASVGCGRDSQSVDCCTYFFGGSSSGPT